jgi:hypothetical protein
MANATSLSSSGSPSPEIVPATRTWELIWGCKGLLLESVPGNISSIRWMIRCSPFPSYRTDSLSQCDLVEVLAATVLRGSSFNVRMI